MTHIVSSHLFDWQRTQSNTYHICHFIFLIGRGQIGALNRLIAIVSIVTRVTSVLSPAAWCQYYHQQSGVSIVTNATLRMSTFTTALLSTPSMMWSAPLCVATNIIQPARSVHSVYTMMSTLVLWNRWVFCMCVCLYTIWMIMLKIFFSVGHALIPSPWVIKTIKFWQPQYCTLQESNNYKMKKYSTQVDNSIGA